RAAVAPGVGRHHPEAPLGQVADDARQHPVEVGVADEAVVEHDRGAGGGLAPGVVDDLDAVIGGDAGHGSVPLATRTCSTLRAWTTSGIRSSTPTTTITRRPTPPNRHNT